MLVLYHGQSKGNGTPATNNYSIGRLYWQKCYRQYGYHLLHMSVNSASTIYDHPWGPLKALCIAVNPESVYRPRLWAKMLVTIQLLPPTNEHPRSVNNIWSCILNTLRAIEPHYPTINLSAAFMGKNAGDDIATTSKIWASTDGQQGLILHHGYSKRCASVLTHIQCIGRVYRQKC